MDTSHYIDTTIKVFKVLSSGVIFVVVGLAIKKIPLAGRFWIWLGHKLPLLIKIRRACNFSGYRNTRLIGYESYVSEIDNILKRRDVRIVNIVGPPTSGKTALAIDYGKRNLHKYDCALHIVCATKGGMKASCVTSLSKDFGDAAATKMEVDSAIVKFKNELEKCHSWLIILDDFPAHETWSEILPSNLRYGHVIITRYTCLIDENDPVVHVTGVCKEHVNEFFKTWFKKYETEVKEIAEKLGYSPSAMVCANRWLKDSEGCRPPDLIREINNDVLAWVDQHADIRKINPDLVPYYNARISSRYVDIVFQRYLNDLVAQNEFNKFFFRVAPFFSIRELQFDLFSQSELIKKIIGKDVIISEVHTLFNALGEVAMGRHVEKGIILHFSAIIAAEYYAFNFGPVLRGQSLLWAIWISLELLDNFEHDKKTAEKSGILQHFLSFGKHVERVYEMREEEFSGEFLDTFVILFGFSGELVLSRWCLFVNALIDVGLYKLSSAIAEPFFHQLINKEGEFSNLDDLALFESFEVIGTACHKAKKYVDAISIFCQALWYLEKTNPKDHKYIAINNKLGSSYRYFSRAREANGKKKNTADRFLWLDLAKEVHEKALACAINLNDDSGIIRSERNLAELFVEYCNVYENSKQYEIEDHAKSYCLKNEFQRAIDFAKEGLRSSEKSQTLNTLARVYEQAFSLSLASFENLIQAKQYLKEALRIDVEKFGLDHPNVAITKINAFFVIDKIATYRVENSPILITATRDSSSRLIGWSLNPPEKIPFRKYRTTLFTAIDEFKKALSSLDDAVRIRGEGDVEYLLEHRKEIEIKYDALTSLKDSQMLGFRFGRKKT